MVNIATRGYRGIVTGCAILMLLLVLGRSAQAKTAYEFVLESQAPTFRSGHTLLPLTRAAWPLTYELNKELCEHWGYALEINPGKTGETLDNPGSDAAKLAALSASNPSRYPASVYTRRVMHYKEDAEALMSEDLWCHDAAGNRLSYGVTGYRTKPYISNADAQAAGQAEVQRLQRLKATGANVALMLNSAEYDITVPGNNAGIWRQDPAVDTWLNALTPTTMVDAFATQKLKQEKAVRDACLSVVGNIPFVYYVTGDPQSGLVDEQTRSAWVWPYRYMRQAGNIVASWQYYYFPDGTWIPRNAGSTQCIPELATNCAAQGIAGGQPLSYNWVCAGWSTTNPDNNSDDAHYMGFLKFLYTLGSVGNAAGYFTYPDGGFLGDVGETAPDWLRQYMVLGQAHAAFSHWERYLRQGDLLPGDGFHPYVANGVKASYEFANTAGDRTVHVVARKLQGKADWFICAWAADGADRNTTVTIPNLGTLTLLARGCGTLYRATPGPTLTLLDPDGMHPSNGLYTITATSGPNGTINDNGAVSVAPGDAMTFTFTPNGGYVVAGVTVDGLPAPVADSYTFTNVTANHTIAVSFMPNATQYTLSVQSQPTGITMLQGTQTRVAPYSQAYPVNTPITLTAPASVTVSGQLYVFQRWMKNGIAQTSNMTGLSVTMSANMTVQAVYAAAITPPVANNQTITTPEDTTCAITLTGSDSYGLPLTFTVLSTPARGVLTGSSPVYSYKPNPNYYGSDSFTVRASNGYLLSSIATITINMTSVNDAPVANNQSVALMTGTTTAIALTGSDAENASLNYVLCSQPAHGTLAGSGTAYTYVPASGYVGNDSFTFKVSDGQLWSTVATISLIVKPANTPPVALNQYVGTDMNKQVYPMLKATDDDGDPLTYSFVSQPAHGALWKRSAVTGPYFTYSPTTGFVGLDSFTFKVNDGVSDSNIATVTINVHALNNTPVAVNRTLTAIAGVATPLTLYATDGDNDQLCYTIVTAPTKGTVTGTAPALIYTPRANYIGTDCLTFKVYDGQANSNLATVSITVTAPPVNTAPVAVNQSLDMTAGTATPFTLQGTDIDNDPLTYIVVTAPTYGTLTGTAPSLIYTPYVGYTGTDTLTFMVHDGKVNSNLGTISFNVTAPLIDNTPPDAVDDAYGVMAGSTLTIDAPGVMVNDSDADGDQIISRVIGTPAHGVLTLGEDGSFTYTPDTGFAGVDSFTYQVSDGVSLSRVANAIITVEEAAMSAVADYAMTTNDAAVMIDVLANDIGIDGVPPIIAVTQGTHGSVVLGADWRITYTPQSSFVGQDTFTYTAKNITGSTAIANVTVDVSAAPVLQGVSLQAGIASPQRINTMVPLTAVPQGGGAIEYRFLVGYNANGRFRLQMLRDYSADPQYVWKPNRARDYVLMVYARQIGHTTEYDATAQLNYTVIDR